MDQKTAAAVVVAAGIILFADDNDDGVPPTPKRHRGKWVNNWLVARDEEGACAKLLPQLASGDHNEQKLFASFHRMAKSEFDHLLDLVTPLISKQNTIMRDAIRPGARLALTLHFLATGNSFHSLAYTFRIPQCTISTIVPEVLDAIYAKLAPAYLKVPSTPDECQNIAQKFEKLWNFPNCVAAIDGKHVVMVAPPNSGSVYYNYKGSHSIILMAICDAKYRILYMDVGCNGRQSDGGVFNRCSFGERLDADGVNLPPPKELPDNELRLPFVFVADDAFALRKKLLKPFPGRNLMPSQRIFNYRLSRARRCVENMFGIMSAKFRVLRSPIHLDAAKTRKVSMACCALHNFLLERNRPDYLANNLGDHVRPDGTITEGSWRHQETENQMLPLQSYAERNVGMDVKAIRKEFEVYFMTTGALPWQFNILHAHE